MRGSTFRFGAILSQFLLVLIIYIIVTAQLGYKFTEMTLNRHVKQELSYREAHHKPERPPPPQALSDQNV